jgi:hypothetical protein
MHEASLMMLAEIASDSTKMPTWTGNLNQAVAVINIQFTRRNPELSVLTAQTANKDFEHITVCPRQTAQWPQFHRIRNNGPI